MREQRNEISFKGQQIYARNQRLFEELVGSRIVRSLRDEGVQPKSDPGSITWIL